MMRSSEILDNGYESGRRLGEEIVAMGMTMRRRYQFILGRCRQKVW
jgi:hypothetical protein